MLARVPIMMATATRPRTWCARTATSRWRNSSKRAHRQLLRAVGDTYDGVYGKWTVREEDFKEVWAYRVSLTVLAASTVTLSTRLVAGGDDIVCALAIASLGIALQLIHIYVTPLKRTLQVFWALGALGFIYVTVADAARADVSTLEYIIGNPWPSTFLVGPIGAAITGITFKEGICYRKNECFLLTIAVPMLFLVHLFGGDRSAPWLGWTLDVVVCALGTVFAARKYTQPVVDDIGDGSVFALMRLSEEEREAKLAQLEADRGESFF